MPLILSVYLVLASVNLIFLFMDLGFWKVVVAAFLAMLPLVCRGGGGCAMTTEEDEEDPLTPTCSTAVDGPDGGRGTDSVESRRNMLCSCLRMKGFFAGSITASSTTGSSCPRAASGIIMAIVFDNASRTELVGAAVASSLRMSL
jgi:hypothetical protein